MWTKKTPTEPGHYWWRESIGFVPIVFLLDTQGVVRSPFEYSRHADTLGGEWCGPLQPPGGDAVENCPEHYQWRDI